MKQMSLSDCATLVAQMKRMLAETKTEVVLIAGSKKMESVTLQLEHKIKRLIVRNSKKSCLQSGTGQHRHVGVPFPFSRGSKALAKVNTFVQLVHIRSSRRLIRNVDHRHLPFKD